MAAIVYDFDLAVLYFLCDDIYCRVIKNLEKTKDKASDFRWITKSELGKSLLLTDPATYGSGAVVVRMFTVMATPLGWCDVCSPCF